MQISPDGFNGSKRAALIVAHPSHESRLYGWLKAVSPSVYILTDGSGLSGSPLINSAVACVEELGAKRGTVFGRFRDVELYEAILNQNLELFCALTDELAEEISEKQFDFVVADAMEGYNPSHDVCRIVADCAIETARKRGAAIQSCDYPMFERPGNSPMPEGTILLNLDDDTFKSKIDMARKYYPKQIKELEVALRAQGNGRLRDFLDTTGVAASAVATGLDMYRTECLRPVVEQHAASWSGRPFYEGRSEAHVLAGRFDRAIKFRDHLLPLATALRAHVSEAQ